MNPILAFFPRILKCHLILKYKNKQNKDIIHILLNTEIKK